jgi:hypothetical protein
MFSEEQLEQLRSYPEITGDELIRYFTPTAADVAFVSPGGRGPVDRLGMLVQLCSLPWLGFVPDDVSAAPPAAVARVAERLGVTPAALRLYGKRDQTRSDHLGQVAKYLEWQTAPAGSQAMKELEQFLLDRAMDRLADAAVQPGARVCSRRASARDYDPSPAVMGKTTVPCRGQSTMSVNHVGRRSRVKSPRLA